MTATGCCLIHWMRIRLYNYIATSTERGSLSPDELWYCHTHTVYESINHLFKHDGKLEQKALDLLKTVNLGDFVVYLKMEPNLIETLTELKKRNGKGNQHKPNHVHEVHYGTIQPRSIF